jgi:hypothetical protein
MMALKNTFVDMKNANVQKFWAEVTIHFPGLRNAGKNPFSGPR